MSLFWSLEPHLVPKVWGGEKLKVLKGLSLSGEPLGESWEISRLGEGSSLVKKESGRELLSDLVGKDQLPYLVKLIDTTDNLSIQVHPDDLFAKAHEDSLGKTECWLILDSVLGAGIYLGLRSGVSQEQLSKAIDNKENISHLMNFYPVKRGDFFFVPAGSIHAIGAGVTLAEIQQSSGVTYRVWDWNRLGLNGKERDLHVNKALQVIEFDKNKNSSCFFQMKKGLLSQSGKFELIRHSDFNVDLYNLSIDSEMSLSLSKSSRLNSLLNLGMTKIEVGDHSLSAYKSVIINMSENSCRLACRLPPTKDIECSSFLHIY
jgi:mannose-6-phosphate isomerase